METTIEKLQKLHQSVQKLETALQEVWSSVDELADEKDFSGLKKQAKQHRSKKQQPNKSLDELCVRMDDFDNRFEEIPEDGGVAVDFEDAIFELIEWIEVNR